MKKLFYLSVLSLLLSYHSLAQWSIVCNSGNGFVVNFVNYDSAVFATGFFTNLCNTTANYIEKWDGITWTPVDSGLTDPGHRLKVIDTQLYIAKYQPAIDSNWVYKWTGNSFVKIGAGVYLSNGVTGGDQTPNIYDVVEYNGNLVASGEFDKVGNKNISGIMQWNGTQWDSLGSGLGGSLTTPAIMYPHQMMVYNNNLYVVGAFTTAGGITANGIAMWDGTQWHAMGQGFNNFVYGIDTFNNEIYVGGEFTASGSTSLKRVAKWNGSNWVDPGFGVYYSNPSLHAYVHTVKQMNGSLYITGGFDHVVVGNDTMVAHSIIAFDGNNVNTLDGGIENEEFEGIATYGSDILVGGGTYNTSYIAKHQLPAAINNVINAKNLTIYPNPVTDHFIIENVKQGSVLNIYNLLGQKVYSCTVQQQSQMINIASLTAGTYVVQVAENNGSRITGRIVKE